jgi:hypothetical protein
MRRLVFLAIIIACRAPFALQAAFLEHSIHIANCTISPSSAETSSRVVNAAGSEAKVASSLYTDVTKAGSRLRNIATDVPPQSFIDNLVENGFTKALSKDGSVTILSRGGTTYSVYPQAASTGGPSALMIVDGQAALKIRLGVAP